MSEKQIRAAQCNILASGADEKSTMEMNLKIIRQHDELAQLRAQLSCAVEALKDIEFCPNSISEDVIFDMVQTAKEALEKIKGMEKK